MAAKVRFFSVAVAFSFLASAPFALCFEEPAMFSAPLLTCSGIPCVDAILGGGKHVRLLIDSGDVQAILSDGAASTLGLELKPANGADGKPVAGYHLAHLQELKIGGGSLEGMTVLVADLKAVTNNRVPEADGFLTYPAFKDRLLELDFVHKTVSISAPLQSAVACKGNCGVLEYPTFGKSGPKIVLTSSFSVNGQPVTAQVDTCYTGSLLIYPEAVKKLGLDEQSHSTVKEFFSYTDGGVDMLKGAARNISFEKLSLAQNPPVYFATPDVHTPDGMFDATIGTAALTRSIVVFNFHDNWISIRSS